MATHGVLVRGLASFGAIAVGLGCYAAEPGAEDEAGGEADGAERFDGSGDWRWEDGDAPSLDVPDVARPEDGDAPRADGDAGDAGDDGGDAGCGEPERHVARFETLNGKKTLIVDGHPFVMLGVYDMRGFSSWDTVAYDTRHEMIRHGSDPVHPWLSDPDIDDYEVYYEWAEQLGFDTVSLTFRWDHFEIGGGRWADGGDPGGGEYPLAWHLRMAERHGLKLILRWFGSNVGSNGSFAPPDVREDEATYPRVEGLRVYDYCDGDILAREQAALRRAMEWIRDHDANRTYIMVQLNNEVKLGEGHEGLTNTAACIARFPSCNYADGDPAPVKEACNQDVFRAHFQGLGAAVHEAVPGFITFMNILLPRGNFPDRPAAGSPDPYDERDPATHEQDGFDPYLAEWLERCPDIDFIGPDIYHLGSREGELDGPMVADRNYWHGIAHPPWYLNPRNAAVRTECGVIPTHNEKPYKDVFKLLGDPEVNLVGDIVYSMTGSVTNSYFQGLIGNDFKFYFDGDWRIGDVVFLPNFYKEFYLENSFRAVRGASAVIAGFQNTPNLVAFASDADTGYDVTDTYTVGGTPVAVLDLRSWGTNHEHRGKARGIVVRTAERDYTLLGVDYEALLGIDASGWDLRVERGHWEGGCWVREADALPGTWSLDGEGRVRVRLSADDVPTPDEEDHLRCGEGCSIPDHVAAMGEWFRDHDAAHQYLVRLFDAR